MTDDHRPTEPFRPTPAAVPPASGGGSPYATTTPPAGGWDPGAPMAGAAAAPVTPVVVAPPKKRSTAATFVNVLLGLAVVVAVGGVAFAAGRATAPAPTNTGRFGNGGFAGNGNLGAGASGAPGRGNFGGGAFGAGGVNIQGTVTAVTADSITIQLANGQSLTIPTDSSTAYHSQTPATAADVTAGKTVQVQLSGGRFLGRGNGGNGGTGNGPTASGGPDLGAASSVTIVPTGS
jgi:hypothetical protein